MMENLYGESHRPGRIEVVCGSMFSGKTEELIRRMKRAKFAKQRVEIFKPSIDTRYSDEDVISHDHNVIPSTPIDSSASILLLSSETDVVGIVIFCFYSFIRLKEMLPVEEYGYDAIFFILLILCFAWGGDTCAYFAGRAFGKHKLCPVVSPKKTVEGAVGGVLGTMVFGVLVTVIYSIAADRMEEFTRSNIGVSMYVIIALLACVAAVLGIYGDLFASVVKRQCGIKDYGTIFPGHGGILDRFDSVMFIAPFVTMVVIAAFYD